MNFYNKIVFSYWCGGIDAAAALYCVFPTRDLGIGSASITYNVIDFASLVFHCIGLAITKQGDCALYEIDAAAALYCVFPLGSSDINKHP